MSASEITRIVLGCARLSEVAAPFLKSLRASKHLESLDVCVWWFIVEGQATLATVCEMKKVRPFSECEFV